MTKNDEDAVSRCVDGRNAESETTRRLEGILPPCAPNRRTEHGMAKRGPHIPSPPFERLIVHAKITNTLLAAQLLQHMTQQDVIGLLKSAGATLTDIAEILGTSYATVAVQSQRLKKKAEAKGERAHGEETEGTAEADFREPGDGPERSE